MSMLLKASGRERMENVMGRGGGVEGSQQVIEISLSSNNLVKNAGIVINLGFVVCNDNTGK